MNENSYSKGIREGYLLGVIDGLRKTGFHENGNYYIMIGQEKILFSKILDQILQEHAYERCGKKESE